jgi:dipeptidyl aminopeptidase/acylaminoacyl peptidase
LDFYTLTPSLDGRRLFFIGQVERRQLARYDARTQQLMPYLPDIPAQFPGPFCFSRDGQWVAYVSSGVLYRSRTDGTGRFQLTAPPLGVESARFSPDGQRIAYQARRAGEPYKIFIVSTQGGEPDQITSGPDQDELADWSADGKTVLFQRDTPSADGERGAYLFDLKSRQISKLPGSEDAQVFRWSPDGQYVIAARTSGPNTLAIGLFAFQAHAWRQLIQPMAFRNLFWSPDSKYVYGQELVGGQRVFRVRISDGHLEWVTSPNLLLPGDVAAWGFAGLAPDGSPLGVLLRRNSDIYALDLDLP